MKKLFITLAIIFLSFIKCFAADFNIQSVTFDDSNSMLVINTYDNEPVSFQEKPVLKFLEDKAYFDINSAVLDCPKQHFVLSSSPLKELVVSQYSRNPDAVRVAFSYNQTFNPANVQFRKLNNTLFFKFSNLSMSSFYFREVYNESGIKPFYEDLSVEIPVPDNSGINKINSAFGQNSSTNYILTKKNMILPTNFYIDDINIIDNYPVLTGIGEAQISRPLRLSNPERIVYNFPNSYVNPVLRNNNIQINSSDSIRTGQFDRTTSRVVITSPQAVKYIPVVYADGQKVIFYDKTSTSYNSLFSVRGNMSSLVVEKSVNNQHSLKFVFSAPVVYGIERTGSDLNIYLYNVDKYPSNFKNELLETAFSGLKVSQMKNGGIKLNMPVELSDYLDILSGHDGKTIRLKYKNSKIVKTQTDLETPKIVIPTVVKKESDKPVIIIDPGHGGSDYGAIRASINEKDIVLDVSKKVKDLLIKKGYDVIMTRDTDEYLSLQDRVDISEGNYADLFISIHVNSSNNESPNGIETHYYKDNSLQLAKCLHASLLNNISANDRGLFKSKFYVINHTTAPAVLLETGFISNPAERAQLVSESRKNATAKAIAEGIDEYFKQK